jgi:NAD(P)H dehydrogenase (quinone)
MAKALIVYYSLSGNTKKMAESIAEGILKEKVAVDVRDVKDITATDLLAYDAIIVGSPTYYGSMAADIKRLFDESFRFHGKLDGKIGAAFASSAHIGGGNETTILDILNAMLIHGRETIMAGCQSVFPTSELSRSVSAPASESLNCSKKWQKSEMGEMHLSSRLNGLC